MDRMREYDIAFVGLKTGTHVFDFQINDKFFELFEGSLIANADVKVKLSFDKRPSFFILDFTLDGKVHLPCDRCAAELDYPVMSDYKIVVKFDDHNENDRDDSDADVVYISRSDVHFNVAQLIYEFINFSIPLNHITCDNMTGEKPCNFEALERLNKLSIKKDETIDHRWDDLTKIKFN